MTITLSKDKEEFVADLIDNGFYDNTEAVVVAALALLKNKLEHKSQLAKMRREIAKGESDIAAGRFGTFTSAVDMLEEIRKRMAINS